MTEDMATKTENDDSKRRNFSNECVFSIDPPTAKDLDDALHVKRLDNNEWEVGVHIADVSHFVPLASPLCKSARERSTSFYLGDKVSRILCSINLCNSQEMYAIPRVLDAISAYTAQCYELLSAYKTLCSLPEIWR